MEKLNNLNLNDELNNFNSEEEQILTKTKQTVLISIQSQDLDQDDENLDLDSLIRSQSSKDIKKDEQMKVPFNMETLNTPEDDLDSAVSKESVSVHHRTFSVSNISFINRSSGTSFESNAAVQPFNDKYLKDYQELCGECQWNSDRKTPEHLIYNEKRNKSRGDVTDCATSVNHLLTPSQFKCITGNEKLFFHATSWLWAKNILETHPRIGNKPGDLAPNGAFYLNPDYSNCYEWFSAKNGVFQGEHAMLIFKFDPWSLDRKGEELSLDQWRNVLQKRNENNCEVPWSLAPQNREPDNVKGQGKRTQPNRMSNGEIAMQLVVRCPRMCEKLSKYLVGCIFYEKVDFGGRASSARRLTDQKHCFNKKEDSSSRTMSKIRGSTRTRRQ